MNEGNIRIYAEELCRATDFRHCLKKIFPELTIYYKMEDSQGKVFATNDTTWKYFRERYILDYCINGMNDFIYFHKKEKVLQYAAEIMNVASATLEDVEEWNDKNEENDNEDYIYIHSFVVIP